jgi:hypothetical protein
MHQPFMELHWLAKKLGERLSELGEILFLESKLCRFLVAVKNKHVVSLELYQQNENVLVGVVGVVPEASVAVGTAG